MIKKEREVPRRLARRERSPPPQSIQVQAQRHSAPAQDAVRSSLKKSPRLGTIGQLAQAWAAGRASATERSLVLRAVSEWATLTPHQLTEPMVSSVINRWRTQFRRSTLHSYRDIFHRFLVFIDRLHGTRHAEHTPKVPAAQPRNHSCTDPDFDRILACSPPWLRFFLLACRLLGLRNSEARTLTPRNFNQDTNTLSFDRKQCGSSNLPVPAELAPALKYAAEVNPTAPILVTLGARSNSKQAIYQAWHKAKQKAAADDSLIIHDLRHTAARRLYNHTKDIRLVQQLLGHKNLSSTLYYIGVGDPADLREMLPAIAPKHQLEQMKPATEVKQ